MSRVGVADIPCESLMERVAARDQQAYAELYDRLSPAVFGMTRRVLRDPSQAEEVTQEVFVELWRRATRFDATRGGVRSWALSIAHHRAVDRVRSEQSRRARDLRDAAVRAPLASTLSRLPQPRQTVM